MKKKHLSIPATIIKAHIASSPPLALTDQIIDTCSQTGLGPLLAEMVLKKDDLYSIKHKDRLLSIQITAKYHYAAQKNALNQFLDRLSDTKIKIILIKGIHTAQSYYQPAYLRLMGDVDILVDKTDAAYLTEILGSLGYEQKSDMPDDFYITHHHLKPFFHNKNDVCLEVHTKLFPQETDQGKRDIYHTNYLFQNLINIPSSGENIFGLNNELNLHYTITHWVREFKISTSLIQLMDIILLINNSDIDWDKFLDGITTRDHATEVKLAFNILDENNLASIPEDVLNIVYSQKDSMGLFGQWLLRYIVNGYLYQSKFITQIVGDTNCSRIWDAYLRNNNGLSNTLYAVRAVLIAPEKDQSALSSTGKRLGRLVKRSVHRLKK